MPGSSETIDALVRGALAAPLDAAPRLILSDACEEAGLDRAVAAIRLEFDLLAAADDPAWEWVPKTHTYTTEEDAASARFPARQDPETGRWYVHRHGCRAWFPGHRHPGGREPKWAGRVFAVAAGRWLIRSGLMPHHIRHDFAAAMTVCGLAAAGLIGPDDRDRMLTICCPLAPPGRQFERDEETYGRLVSPWQLKNPARSGKIGSVQWACVLMSRIAGNRGPFGESPGPFYLDRNDPDTRQPWAAWTNENMVGSYHRASLRMVGRLRAFLGIPPED